MNISQPNKIFDIHSQQNFQESGKSMIDNVVKNFNIPTLYQFFLMLHNVEDYKAFMNDLLTPSEIKAIKERFKVAQMLSIAHIKEQRLSYRKIQIETGVSIATITRVARYLNHETNEGYKTIIAKCGIDCSVFEALTFIETEEECKNFFYDILTPQEIEVAFERIVVAYLLAVEKLTQSTVNNITGISAATVTRVARFYEREKNKGYVRIFDKYNEMRKMNIENMAKRVSVNA